MPEIIVDERDLEPTFLDAAEAQTSTDDADARSLLSTHLNQAGDSNEPEVKRGEKTMQRSTQRSRRRHCWRKNA